MTKTSPSKYDPDKCLRHSCKERAAEGFHLCTKHQKQHAALVAYLESQTTPDPLCKICKRQFCKHQGNEVVMPELPRSEPNPRAWDETREFLMSLPKGII